jgi:hypothetical protein
MRGLLIILLWIISFFLFSQTMDILMAPDKMHWLQKIISFYGFYLIGKLSDFK